MPKPKRRHMYSTSQYTVAWDDVALFKSLLRRYRFKCFSQIFKLSGTVFVVSDTRKRITMLNAIERSVNRTIPLQRLRPKKKKR